MKIHTDGSTTRVCFVPEGKPPHVIELPFRRTSNEGEYIAALEALRYAQKAKMAKVEIVSDSELLVHQMNTRLLPNYRPMYAIKADNLRDFAEQLERLVKADFESVTFTWVPRSENKAGRVLG